MGAVHKANNYFSQTILLFNYGTIHSRTKKNTEELRDILRHHGKIQDISSNRLYPLESVLSGLRCILRNGKRAGLKITWDITTFTRQHILLMLKGLEIFGLLESTRLIYTEPKEYVATTYKALSYGLARFSVVPTFEGVSYPSKKSLAVLFLGYEGERALALYELLAPNECLLIIPDPPYYPEWKGRTQMMNQGIISAVGSENERFVDSRNPLKVAEQLAEIFNERKFAAGDFNLTFCHLGTKPQLVGLYNFAKTMRRKPSIVYSAPKGYNSDAYSQEIGRTWILPH